MGNPNYMRKILFFYSMPIWNLDSGLFGSLSGGKFNILFKINIIRYFEWFILFVIFLNSIALTMFDYKDRSSETQWNQILDSINLGFTVVYSIEAFLKIIAYGFIIHRLSYLREIWNLIDFIVVLSG